MNPYRTDDRNSDHSDHYPYRADPIDRARADAIMAHRRTIPHPHGELHLILMEYARMVRTDREHPCEGKNALIRWNYAKSTVADNEILPEPSDFDFDRRGDAQEARYELIGDDGPDGPFNRALASVEPARLRVNQDGGQFYAGGVCIYSIGRDLGIGEDHAASLARRQFCDWSDTVKAAFGGNVAFNLG